jgi:putative nucleotidyltransferase with HDIG domain
VIVLPALAVSFIETSGRPWLLLLSVLLAMALSVAAATLGAALWARRPNSQDFVFADLMLWGWLRRVRAERRLAEAHRLLGSSGIDGQSSSRERCCRVLQRLAAMLEAKDTDTLGHSRRVTRHAERIARGMGLSDEEVARVRIAASVHDIGKVHTPRAILAKPGSLTDDEIEVMRRHPVDGARMTAEMGDPEITAIVRHHHERLDGSGYPDGLRGDAIPLGSRIVSVADTFDAITSSRRYHGTRAHRQALEAVSEEAGTRLDPDAVAAFLRYYSGKRAVAWSAFGFTGTPRLANWLAGALNGAGAWASPMVQSFAAIAAAALASVALDGPPPQATVASHRPFAAAIELSNRDSGARDHAGREGGRAEGTPRAHVVPVADRPGSRPRPDAPIQRPPGGSAPPGGSTPPGGSAPPGGSTPGDASPSLPNVDAPTVDVPDAEVPAVDVPGVELPDVALPEVTLPHLEVPLSQLLPGAEDLDLELPPLRLNGKADN